MSKFTCKLPVKSYIKSYLENNCGSPADLSGLPEIYDFFVSSLRRPRFHRDNHSKCNYSDSIDIMISEDIFHRFGWQLSKTDTIRFNQRCEAFIKFNSRQFIMANNALGIPVSECIREFQQLYNFSEDSFSYETIKKDFDRHGTKASIKLIRDFRKELNTILLGNLSNLGTISKTFKDERDT
jgi:hypothetical protein